MQAGQASWSMSSLVAKRARAFRGVQSCRAVAAVDHQCLLSVPRSTLTSLAVDVAYLVCGSESYAIATALAPHAASLDMIYPQRAPFLCWLLVQVVYHRLGPRCPRELVARRGLARCS
jgi:hypothetical protein